MISKLKQAWQNINRRIARSEGKQGIRNEFKSYSAYSSYMFSIGYDYTKSVTRKDMTKNYAPGNMLLLSDRCVMIRRKNYSEYRGVSWNKRRRTWCGFMDLGGQRYHLGTFATEDAAREAVVRATAAKLIGYLFKEVQ